MALSFSTLAQVRHEDVAKGPGEDWLTYAGTYSGWRYSPLKQITADNVKNLVPKWVYHVPDARGLRSSPIVYQGVLYITNTNSVYAIDARSGRLVWQYADPRAEKGGVNRGSAIWGLSCRGVAGTVGFVFESMFDIDPGASQAELRARVEEFEGGEVGGCGRPGPRDGVVGRQTPGC